VISILFQFCALGSIDDASVDVNSDLSKVCANVILNHEHFRIAFLDDEVNGVLFTVSIHDDGDDDISLDFLCRDRLEKSSWKEPKKENLWRGSYGPLKRGCLGVEGAHDANCSPP
jgi:hypothetical protein